MKPMNPMNINHIVNWTVKRIKKNKNAIIVINGQTGSGKTYVGLQLAHEIAQAMGTEFSVNNNVDFSFIGLLKKTMREENSKPGTCFLFEEVGAYGGGASARDWQSKANRFFWSFLQTTRHRNQVLIFTCPMFSFLDSGARVLCHMQIMMLGIDYKNQVSITRPYLLQVNTRTGKIYFKLMRYYDKRGIEILIEGQRIHKPNDKILLEYEIMKEQFTGSLNQSIIDEEEKAIKKAEPKPLTPIQQEVYELLKEGTAQQDIALKLSKSKGYISNIVKIIGNKGVSMGF